MDDLQQHCVTLAQEVAAAREHYRRLKDDATAANEIVDRKERELVELMDANHMPKFAVEGIGTLFRSARVFAKITDMELAKQFLAAKGLEREVLHLTAVRTRLNAIMTELVEEGEPIPPGFEYTVTPTLNIRKEAA